MAICHRRPKLKLEAFGNGIVVRLPFAFRKCVCAFLPEEYLKVKTDDFFLLKCNWYFCGYFCFETLQEAAVQWCLLLALECCSSSS